MNHKLSVTISKKLVDLGTIHKKDEEIYIYGFELIFSFIFSVSIILAVGYIIHKILETIIFLTLFILIRQFTGGFHADTYMKCQIFTISFYLCVISISQIIQPSVWAYFVLWLSGTLIITLIGPVENPNKPLSDKQRKKNKLRGVVIFDCVCIFGLSLCSTQPSISNTIFYSLLLIIILMIIPFFERRIHHA